MKEIIENTSSEDEVDENEDTMEETADLLRESKRSATVPAGGKIKAGLFHVVLP